MSARSGVTPVTTGPDGKTLFDKMTAEQIAAVLEVMNSMPGAPPILGVTAAALRHLSEWKSMETAPRDGTQVDLWYVPPYSGSQRRMPDRWWVKGRGWRTSPGPDFMPDRVFTGWRPTPPHHDYFAKNASPVRTGSLESTP